MKLTLGLAVLVSSCAHSAAPAGPAATPAAQPAAPAPITAAVARMETGSDLKVVVSFKNDGAAPCEVSSYALAWGSQPEAVRAPCAPGVTLSGNGTAEATCVIPGSSPMRDEGARREANMEVVDLVATCRPTP